MSYTELKTPKATFRFLHRLEGNQGFKKDLPREFDAALIEMVHQNPITDSDDRAAGYVSGLKSNPDLADLREQAQKNHARLYFGDLAENQTIASNKDLNLMALEFIAGLVALSQGLSFLFGKKKKSILLGLAFLGTGLWFISSIFELFGFFLVRVAGNTTRKGFLKGLSQTLTETANWHPEKTVVFLRNLVLAEKAWEIVSLHQKKDHRPLILLDFHFGHAGILKMINWHRAFRRALLKTYRPFLKPIFKNPVQYDYFARLTSVFWDKTNWQLERSYLVDSLEELKK